MGGGFEVVRVNGEERGGVGIKLPANGPAEGRVSCEVKVSKPD